MIERILVKSITDTIQQSSKIVVIYGARQVGKTTLVQEILKQLPYKKISINADILKYNEVFASRDLNKMKELIDQNELLFIDEAQNIKDIGINLKILHDHLPELKIIVTGSSSFELANHITEPLTGRTQTFQLFPISIQELRKSYTPFEIKENVSNYLLYGMYPEVIQTASVNGKIKLLYELTSAYLYKDVLQLTNIKHSDKIHKLLKLLASQIGNLISMNEIGNTLQMTNETVNHYIDILEKGFIIFRLSGYDGNIRKEITKMNKVYFYDLGIRNALIDSFNSLEIRQDTGALWENFILIERMKKNVYADIFNKKYFWRTYSGAEIDYVEVKDGTLHGYEIKWKNNKVKQPKSWLETYSNTTFQVINNENFIDFVSG
jgi:predicted AAA+ superfamily ATPase